MTGVRSHKRKPGRDRLARLPEDLKVCDCADCRLLLLAPGQEERTGALRSVLLPPLVAGRILGRPYCMDCLRVQRFAAARRHC